MNGTDTRILTFDSLLRHYESRCGFPCNIIALTKGKVRFKKLNVLPRGMLQFMSPADIILTTPDKNRLKRWGVSLKGFEQGHPFPIEVQMRKMRAAMEKRRRRSK